MFIVCLSTQSLEIRKKLIRAVIVKLSDTFEKHMIMKSLNNLKAYNDCLSETRREENPHNQRQVFISEHLPQEFLKYKKMLMPQFKAARQEGRKTFWNAEDGLLLSFHRQRKGHPQTVICFSDIFQKYLLISVKQCFQNFYKLWQYIFPNLITDCVTLMKIIS